MCNNISRNEEILIKIIFIKFEIFAFTVVTVLCSCPLQEIMLISLPSYPALGASVSILLNGHLQLLLQTNSKYLLLILESIECNEICCTMCSFHFMSIVNC